MERVIWDSKKVRNELAALLGDCLVLTTYSGHHGGPTLRRWLGWDGTAGGRGVPLYHAPGRHRRLTNY